MGLIYMCSQRLVVCVHSVAAEIGHRTIRVHVRGANFSRYPLPFARARGIPAEVARQSLVYSFGAEVVQGLRYDKLVARIQADVVAALRVAEAEITAAA